MIVDRNCAKISQIATLRSKKPDEAGIVLLATNVLECCFVSLCKSFSRMAIQVGVAMVEEVGI
jgi:hypothetical protein